MESVNTSEIKIEERIVAESLVIDVEGFEVPGKYTEIVPPLNFAYADAYEKFVRGEYEYGDILLNKVL